MPQYSSAQIKQLIDRKNATLPKGRKFNPFGKTKGQIEQFLGVRLNGTTQLAQSNPQGSATSKIAETIAAKTGMDAAKIHAALKKNAQTAIDKKRQQLQSQGKTATQQDLRQAAIEAIKTTAQKAMSSKTPQSKPVQKANTEIASHHVIKPHSDPYGAAGSKEKAKRQKPIEALIKKLENGRLAYNPNDPRRVETGKDTALTALRDAKNPKVGLIGTKNADGEHTGFLSYKTGGKAIEISHIGTDQSQKGAGRKMFNELLTVAAQQKKGLIVTAEKDAIGFYEKMGMTHLGHGDFEMSASEVVKAAKAKA